MRTQATLLTGLLVGLLLLGAGPNGARADGLLLGAGAAVPVSPSSTSVRTLVQAQVATTVAELRFEGHDPELSHQILFPVSAEASVVGFAVLRDGRWQEAEISGDDAMDGDDVHGGGGHAQRSELMRYLGDNPFVANLPPSAEPYGVRLTWVEILPYDQGEVHYRYPLAPPVSLASEPSRAVTIEVEVLTERRLQGIMAPSHNPYTSVRDRAEHSATLRMEVDLAPKEDFHLLYSVAQEQELFVRLLTDHEDCEEPGFFLLVVEPRQDVSEQQAIPKYFSFVVDVSGSMSGYKIEQARAAAAYAIQQLNPDDRFNVVTFNDTVMPLFEAPRPSSLVNRDRAAGFVSELWASGGTNLEAALTTAMEGELDQGFARIVVLLTDGRPTAGVTHPDAIQRSVRSANTSDSRLFCFGVGSDVDTVLLRGLASGHRGEARFLAADDDIAATLGEFFAKVDRPVLTDVTLDLGALAVQHLHPDAVTDLFAGSQLFVLGRYTTGGATRARLSGSLRGAPQQHEFDLEFPVCARDEHPFLPRLWAKARIDALLGAMAEAGSEDSESVDEIEALATRYGIQTPYTSFGLGDGGAGEQSEPEDAWGGGGGGNGYYNPDDYDPGRHGFASGALDRRGWAGSAISTALLVGLGLLLLGTRRRRHP